ncbi:hypothetical protein V865_005404 [Kwoniella europaea PYCC6329]|uniref:BTB domain-containing protein n=1 Tax=Kwoniella europaea PYCC6329 TaxID=1423913 RepID=A0AAX4KLK3_9TREE
MPDDQGIEIVVNDHNRPFQFDDSDLRLVSADDVVFNIHTWKLKAASSVFQAMFEAGNGNSTVKLTDETLENGRILSMFLKILYGIHLEDPSDRSDLMMNHEILLQFVVKYDASAAKEHLTTCFRLWASNAKLGSDRYFLLGSQLNQYEIATASLKRAIAVQSTWTGPPDGMGSRQALLLHGIKNERTLNIASWPFYDFRKLSHEYMFGFMRAREIVMEPNKSKVDYKLVAAEFEKIMKDLTLEDAN